MAEGVPIENVPSCWTCNAIFLSFKHYRTKSTDWTWRQRSVTWPRLVTPSSPHTYPRVPSSCSRLKQGQHPFPMSTSPYRTGKLHSMIKVRRIQFPRNQHIYGRTDILNSSFVESLLLSLSKKDIYKRASILIILNVSIPSSITTVNSMIQQLLSTWQCIMYSEVPLTRLPSRPT